MEKMVIETLADNVKIGDVELGSKGTRFTVDKATGADLIEKGLAKDVTIEVEQEAFDKRVADEVAKQLNQNTPPEPVKKQTPQDQINKATIEVKAPELDPCAGYVGQKEKSDYTQQEINVAYGRFIQDVLKEGSMGETPSEKLTTWVKACKAAGSGIEAGDDGLGGFLLAPMFSTQFVDSQLEQSVIRPSAMIIAGDARSLELPMINGYDHSSGKLFGNMDGFWEAENATLTASRPMFEKPGLVKKKLTVLVHVSAEMMRWSPLMMGSMLNPMMAQVISWKEDHAYINGDGAGIPLGLLNCNCVESQAAETNQTAATIVYENVLNMRSKLWMFNRSSVAWIANPDIIPQLAQMSLTIGTGGSAVYNPANVAAGQAFDSFMGFPIRYTEKCPALGTVGDIILADLSTYVIFDDARGMDVASSIHIKFLEAQETMRVLKWEDAQCRVRSAFTPNSGNDKSPIVTLATRS